MAKRSTRENPLKTRDKALIGGGAALLLGFGLFLLTRPKSTSKDSGSSANVNTQNGGAQPGSTVSQTPYGPRANAPPPPPPSNITSATQSFTPAVPRNTPNVSWVQGP